MFSRAYGWEDGHEDLRRPAVLAAVVMNTSLGRDVLKFVENARMHTSSVVAFHRS